jgi:hypothetical protein
VKKVLRPAVTPAQTPPLRRQESGAFPSQASAFCLQRVSRVTRRRTGSASDLPQQSAEAATPPGAPLRKSDPVLDDHLSEITLSINIDRICAAHAVRTRMRAPQPRAESDGGGSFLRAKPRLHPAPAINPPYPISASVP